MEKEDAICFVGSLYRARCNKSSCSVDMSDDDGLHAPGEERVFISLDLSNNYFKLMWLFLMCVFMLSLLLSLCSQCSHLSSLFLL